MGIGLLLSSLVQGQYDSLKTVDFDLRQQQLAALVERQPTATDSARIMSRFDSLIQLANADHRNDIAIELTLYKHVQSQFFKNASYDQIEAALEGLYQEVKRRDKKELVATAEFFIAQFLWDRQKQHQRSMLFYEKAYQNARLLPDRFFYKQRIVYETGEKYFYLSDYATAIDFLVEANSITNSYDPHHPYISINNTLGLAYRTLNQFTKAQTSFERGLQHAQEVQAKAWIGILSGNLGHIHIRKGDTLRGVELLMKDKTLSLERGARASASGALIELARLNASRGKTELAERQLDSSVALIPNTMPYYRRAAYYSVQSEILRNKGRWKEAVIYIDSALMIRDSLIKKDEALRLVRMNQRLELEQSRSAIVQAEEKQRRQRQQIEMMIGLLLLLLGGGGLLYRQKRKTDRAKKRSDALLLNILPESVADELKQFGSAKAQRFEQVTVVFTDFKDFTLHSEKLLPRELVSVLNDYFKAFDEISSRCGMEKIKTVGDAYLCASGLPQPDEEHAKRAVDCALQMQEFMKSCPHDWQLRVGIHSGPVVAGIVGIKKFAYDIWGDTVNMAARMEQNCEPGRVNLSAATYELVRNDYNCVHRGKILAKNKGEVDMYYVRSD